LIKEIKSDNYYLWSIGFINNKQIAFGGWASKTSDVSVINIDDEKVLKKYSTASPVDLDYNNAKSLMLIANHQSIILVGLSDLTSVLSDHANTDTTSPNPTNGISQINFNLPKSGLTRVTISDMLSNEISILYDGFLEQGEHNFQWIANNVPSGTYYCNIVGQNFSKTLKIMVQK